MVVANTPTSGSEHSNEQQLDSDYDRFTASNEAADSHHSHSTSNAPAASSDLGALLGFGSRSTRHGPTAAGVLPASPGDSSLFARLGNGSSAAKERGGAAGAAVAGRVGESGVSMQVRDRIRDRSRPRDHSSDEMGARAYGRQRDHRDRPSCPFISSGANRTGAFGFNGPQEHVASLDKAEGDICSAPHLAGAASAQCQEGQVLQPSHSTHRHAVAVASPYPGYPQYPPSAWHLHQRQLHHAGQHPMYGPTHQRQPWQHHPSGPRTPHVQQTNHGFPPHPPPPPLPPHHQQIHQQQAPLQSTPVSSLSVPGQAWLASASSSDFTSKDLANVQSPPPAGSVPFPSSSRQGNTNDNDNASHIIPHSHQGTRRRQQQLPAHPSAWPSHPYYHQQQYPQAHYGMSVPTVGWDHNPHWHPPPIHLYQEPSTAVPYDSRQPSLAARVPAASVASHGDSNVSATPKVTSVLNSRQGFQQRVLQQPGSAHGHDATIGFDAVTQSDCDCDSLVEHPSPAKPPHNGGYLSSTGYGVWPPPSAYNRDTAPDDLYAPHHHDPSAYAWQGPPFHPPPHRHGYSPTGPPPPLASVASAAAARAEIGAVPSTGPRTTNTDTVFDPITQSTLDQFFPETPTSATGQLRNGEASGNHGFPGHPTMSPTPAARGSSHRNPMASFRQPPTIPPGPPAMGVPCADPYLHAAYHHFDESRYPLPAPHGPHSSYPAMYYPPSPPPPFPPSFSHMAPAFPGGPGSFGPHSPTDYEPPHPSYPSDSFDQPDPVSPSRALRLQIGRRATTAKVSGGTRRKVQKTAEGGRLRFKSKTSAAASAAAPGGDSNESDESDADEQDDDDDGDDYDYDDEDGDEARDGGRRSTKKRKGASRKQQGNQVGSTLFVRGKPVDGGQSRSYLVFTREAYAKMVKCLQLAALAPEDVYSSVELRKEWKDAAESSSVRKRWKRLQFNLQVVPDRQEYRQLAWRSSTLIIAPREDWDDILREAHHSDLPPEQHVSVRQTIMSIREQYETRRSRCGITAEAIDSFCHRCECYRRLLSSIPNESEADELRAAGNSQVQGQTARTEQEDEEMMDQDEPEPEDEND